MKKILSAILSITVLSSTAAAVFTTAAAEGDTATVTFSSYGNPANKIDILSGASSLQANITLTTSDNSVNKKVVLALYDGDGKLVKTAFSDLKSGTGTAKGTVGFESLDGITASHEAKVMIWDDLSSCKPAVESVICNSDSLKPASIVKKMSSTVRGFNYTRDDAMTMTVVTDGERFGYRVTDFKGNDVKHERAVTNDAGKRYKVMDFSDLPEGYYELSIYPDLDGSDAIARTSFSIFKSHEFTDGKNSPFGMNVHSQRSTQGWMPALLEECKKIGSMSIRDDREWSATEQEKGVYNYSYPCADYIYKNNMDYIIVTGFNNQFYDNGATPYTEEVWTGFANFSKALYDLYPQNLGGLTNMEAFNEWFVAGFGDKKGNDGFDGPADALPETYVPLAKKTYDTVKAAYPDAVIFGQLCYDLNWTKRAVDAGLADCMDKAALHVYSATSVPEKSSLLQVSHIQKYRDMLKEKSGKDFEIWVTETGGNTAKNGISNFTEKEQAEAVPRIHCMLLEAGVTKVFWYDLLDDGLDMTGPNANEDNFGLLRANGSKFGAYTPKPSYVSYGVMARMLDGKSFTGKDKSGDAYCYEFSDENSSVKLVYSLSPRTVTVKTESEIIVTDLMGKETAYTPVNGEIRLDIDGGVQYLDGNLEIIL